MKYRHSRHAGNHGDVLKHTTLLALLDAALSDGRASAASGGLLYLDTHSGSGLYSTSEGPERGGVGVGALIAHFEDPSSPPPPREVRSYLDAVRSHRRDDGRSGGGGGGTTAGERIDRARIARGAAYPGSPLLAAGRLRGGRDRGIAVDVRPGEAEALRAALEEEAGGAPLVVEAGDGFLLPRRYLPPAAPLGRALVLVDPPYEDAPGDFAAALGAASDCVQLSGSSVCVAVWYPIREGSDRSLAEWKDNMKGVAANAPGVSLGVLFTEVWLSPRGQKGSCMGSFVGSGMLIINPPHEVKERMEEWVPKLHSVLDPGAKGGFSVELDAARV